MLDYTVSSYLLLLHLLLYIFSLLLSELFRTGPRPRRKDGNSREASTAGTLQSQEGKESVNSDSQRAENIYKQINHVDHVGRSIFGDPSMSSALCPGCKYSVIPSYNPEDIPDTDAVTSTPLESSSVTTTTTPLTPVNQEDMCGRLGVGGIQKSSVPTLNHKNNRRYKHVHRLLPARIAKCFICGDRSSRCVLSEQSDSSKLHKSAKDQEQTFTLTEVEGTQLLEEFYTNTGSGFQNHNCMLFRPSDLDVPKHSNVCDKIKVTKCRTPLAEEVELRMSRLSPLMAEVFSSSASDSDKVYNISSPCRSASYKSLVLSSDQVFGNREEATVYHDSSEQGHETLQEQISFVPKSVFTTAYPVFSTTQQMRPVFSQNDLSLTASSNCSAEINLTNFRTACDGTNLNSSSIQLSERSSSPVLGHLSPLLPNHASSLTCSISPHTSPKYHKASKSKTFLSTPSPLSNLSDSLSCNQQNPNSPLHHFHDKQQSTTNPGETHITPVAPSKVDSRSKESTISPKSIMSRLHDSPDKKLFSSVRNSRINHSEIEKLSRHSELSIIPQSPAGSPDHSVSNLDSFPQGNNHRISPLHVQTSVESRHESPISSIHSNCKKKDNADVGLQSLGTPDSSCQKTSSVNSMETSV